MNTHTLPWLNLRKSLAHVDHPDQPSVYAGSSRSNHFLKPLNARTIPDHFAPYHHHQTHTMKPKAPQLRNQEVPSRLDRLEQRDYEAALTNKLRKETQLKYPPSQHVRAYREYERAWHYARGLQPLASHMDYHLWSDAASSLRSAHNLLTDDGYRKRTGRMKKTTPRHALATLAEAVGYRYMRGLEVITDELASNKHLTKFKLERLEFEHAFNESADAAHALNDGGQNPVAALEVVNMFQRELLALCPWLELVGNAQAAQSLREAVKLEW
jgi:hypothetical protein